MAKQKDYKVGIYVRLSKEDERAGESVSIENQVLMLTNHVKSQGWELVETYCDDGFSGTNQNRPALQSMLADVRGGRINTLLIKDLSRLGRNYLEVGNLAEVFLPEHGCELISLTEKMDGMMVFRNWFNEQHSKDTSKKVRDVKRMFAQDGKFIGAFAPYGYRKDEENKHLLVPDPGAAPIVQKIFELRAGGMGYKAIAQHLNEAGITPPRDYYYQQKGKDNPHRINHSWGNVTVKGILCNEAYIGNMVQLRFGSASYKSHKLVRKDQENWVRTEGTHEPIVNRELWDKTQALIQKQQRTRKNKNGTANLFTGFLVCADCGFKMRGQTQRKVRKNGNLYSHTNYVCGTYSRNGKTACTTHTIGEKVLCDLVMEQIRIHARMVACDEGRIAQNLLRLMNSESETGKTAYLSELKAHKTRISMLEKLIEKLCEDRLTGVVPETVYRNLIQKYEQERIDRSQAVENLESRIQNIQRDSGGVNKWIELIRDYTELDTLDAHTLRSLVDYIEIGDAVEIDGAMAREIKVVYNYVGDIGALRVTATGSADGKEAPEYGQAV